MAPDYEITGDIEMTYDAQKGYGDLTVHDRDLEREDGLRTALILSLFSNRRAEEVDALPDNVGAREGWWADKLRVGDDLIGSKLWIIGRSKMEPNVVLPLAKQYGREALQWMIDDGVADDVQVDAAFFSDDAIELTIHVTRPGVERSEFFRYYYNWQAERTRSE